MEKSAFLMTTAVEKVISKREWSIEKEKKNTNKEIMLINEKDIYT